MKPSWKTRIVDLLANLRVGHAELASLIGVDQATIWRWANGKGSPPSHLIQGVVEALERIVALGHTEAFFRAIRVHRIAPHSRQMFEAIFHYSSERSLA